jgi:hypothetical protein
MPKAQGPGNVKMQNSVKMGNKKLIFKFYNLLCQFYNS